MRNKNILKFGLIFSASAFMILLFQNCGANTDSDSTLITTPAGSSSSASSSPGSTTNTVTTPLAIQLTDSTSTVIPSGTAIAPSTPYEITALGSGASTGTLNFAIAADNTAGCSLTATATSVTETLSCTTTGEVLITVQETDPGSTVVQTEAITIEVSAATN